MKKLSKVLLSVFLLWACVLNLHAQVASRESNLLESKDIIAFRPIDIMATPQTLMKVWIDEPMPLSFYTPQEKEAQKLINEKTADGIITYSPLSAEKEWTSIDFEEITPYTWKWIDLELLKPDGSLTKVALRRPHEWLRGIGADVGKQVYLDMPEMGVQGWATIKAIRVNQLDTRFWDENRKGDYVSRPITGKFEHESSDVYYLHFGDNPEPLGVTGSHPIWSIDRNTWVGASELRIGEKVKTQDGLTVLKSRTKSDKRQKVYNLEIYKDHNFLVSTDKILVHNSCFPLSSVKNWSSKTGSTFGHTFLTHGKKEYKNLVGRLETGNSQGHWLNDDAVALYLESIKDNIEKLQPGEAFDFPLPAGLGQILSKDAAGEIISTPATSVRVVRGSEKSRSFIRSAFPVD